MDDETLKKTRYELLVAEVESEIPGFIEKLKAGKRVILCKHDALGDDLTIERLAFIGRIVKVCEVYGAIVVFNVHIDSVLSMSRPQDNTGS
jgi:hypothetical protein